ncbi:MAG: hypothetical protein HY060_20650 [Proteobacteria bacterium]|nr:hypothetical protein [Pseudomonadota bacterium]
MVPVLVIDRDRDRLADSARVLASHGYCPLTARSDSDALAVLRDMPIQVAIAQITPTDAGDVALIDSIRRRFPHVSVVAAVDARALRRGRVALDVAEIVGQPFAPALLLNAVGRCLFRELAA